MSYRKTENNDGVTLAPEDTADAAVIWLHGLGADGNDFVPIVPELSLPAGCNVRFLFPHAAVRPVTLNGGMAMRAWYDIVSLDRDGPHDAAGIQASGERVAELVGEQRAAGIDVSRIVLAGFSQGGAIAQHVALRYPERLGGLLALSTYLPLAWSLADEATDANRDLPILMCHGTHDPMLPVALGKASFDLLMQQGYAPEWREYPMQHQVCMEEISDISDWLGRVLGR